MNAEALNNAKKILAVDDFAVGDFVHHRTWTVPPAGDQQPIVNKRVMKVVDINDNVITCGGNKSFDAFELIKSDWSPA